MARDDRLQVIRARLDAISKGKWIADKEIDGVYADRMTVVRRERTPEESVFVATRIVTVGQTRRHDRNAENNVAFIANAPEDVAFLLAEIEGLQDALRNAVEAAENPRYGW